MNKKDTNSVKLSDIGPILLVVALFFIPFFISYAFTFDYLSRSSSVGEEEEAAQIHEFLGEKDLALLYKNSVADNSIKNKLIILGYHQIREYKDTDGPKTKLFITSPEIFEKEMKYLVDNNYKSISLSEYINYLNNKSFSIPEKAVIITFDDGYRSQYDYALPVLKKYNLTATFFVYSDCIDKYNACMTMDNLRELANNNMKIANHTTHHVFLPKYKDATIAREIIDNQNYLEKELGKDNVVNILAYPFGGSDERVQNIARESGMIGAVGVAPLTKKDENIFNLSRYLLGNNYDFFKSLFEK